jgi:hypothetical protein
MKFTPVAKAGICDFVTLAALGLVLKRLILLIRNLAP